MGEERVTGAARAEVASSSSSSSWLVCCFFFISLEATQRSRQPSGGSVSHALLLKVEQQQQWGNSFAVLSVCAAALDVYVWCRSERDREKERESFKKGKVEKKENKLN